jgi:hypothetical protein
MGFFNFIETFFFLSLGITFVLILLLVYHFKQRVTTLEQKCDTMFDILNTMVKELNAVRNAQVMLQQFPFSQLRPGLSPHLDPSKIHVSDDDETSEDSSDIGDHSSDDESDDNSVEGSEGEDEDEDEGEGDESDDDNKMPPLVETASSADSVKIINVEIGDTIELDELILDPISDTELENSAEETIDPPEDLQIEDPIRVEKMNATEPVEEPVATLEDTAPNTSKEIPKDMYRRMPLQNLKTLVISKGLSSDPSRLKKIDLVRMLEEAEE